MAVLYILGKILHQSTLSCIEKNGQHILKDC